jgi:hypothetical protein
MISTLFVAIALTTPPAPKDWVTPLLAQSRTTVEKTLGKPTETVSEVDNEVMATYKHKTFENIYVLYKKNRMEFVTFEFKTNHRSWQAALKELTIPTTSVKSKTEQIEGQEFIKLKNFTKAPKGWSANFFPADDSTKAIISFCSPNHQGS